MIYLIGSLRNPEIPKIAAQLRESTGQEVFDDWFAAGPEADDYWRTYEQGKGHTLPEALQGHAARNVFEFDKRNLERADTVVLVLPAGRSGHLELGWSLGRGKRGFILLDADPDRYDVMYGFADGVFNSMEDLIDELTKPITPADIIRQEWNPGSWIRATSGECAVGCRCIGCFRAVGNL